VVVVITVDVPVFIVTDVLCVRVCTCMCRVCVCVAGDVRRQ